MGGPMDSTTEAPPPARKSKRKVDLIASGYEWICPICLTQHREIEARAKVVCKTCNHDFLVGEVHHAGQYDNF
jgi:DNA-directed RNA polymerase subunit RPC12/RpoP